MSTTPSRQAARLFADRPAKIRRPRVFHAEPRLEGTPEEAQKAQALIRAREARR